MGFKKEVLPLVFILIVLLAVVSITYIIPFKSRQYATILIEGTNYPIAEISFLDMDIYHEPIIKIFSKRNPSGQLKLGWQIYDQKNNLVLWQNISQVGIGSSKFRIGGDGIKSNFTIKAEIYYLDKKLDSKSYTYVRR